MRAAVVTWDGGGNREPFEALCRELLRRETDVHVLSHEAHRVLYEPLGASFDALPIGAKVASARPSEKDDTRRAVSTWISEENARAVLKMLTAASFDIVIVDVSMLNAFAACEAAGIPFVALHHTLPGSVLGGSRRERFEALIGPVNQVRSAFGLTQLDGMGKVMAAAQAHIVPTASMLDSPVPWELPLHYVGPMKPPEDTKGELPDLPARFILVSFSTTWQRQIGVLQATIDALSAIDRSVVITTGPAVDPAELLPAANTLIVSELPHRRILGDVDVVVTHAGHGTVLSALSAGVPLVCLPMGRDQYDVTRRVVEIGAGVEVSPNRIGQDLASAVEHVLRGTRFARGAAAIARDIARHGGVDEAIAVIERFA